MKAELDPHRRAEVKSTIELLTRWAHRRDDVLGLALVGSWARGAASMESDVDFIVITDSPRTYPESLGSGVLPEARSISRRRRGTVTEYKLRLPSGLELELNVAPARWASAGQVDAGTRRVVVGGFRILHDPHLLLQELARACSVK